MKFSNLMIAAISLHGAAAATLRGDQKRSLQTLYYPRYTGNYDTGWCSTTNIYAGGSQGYSTELACCNAVFPGQTSGTCYSKLPAPPTTAPTPTNGVDIWYADLTKDWAAGVCINTLPTPNGRTTYDSQLECCKGSYTGQTSGACIQDLPSPPTTAPTPTNGVDIWYADLTKDWAAGVCINTLPTPNGRTTYDSQLECCKGSYTGQTSGACIQDLPDPPTSAPTPSNGVDIWYADLSLDWAAGVCINTLPTPNGRTTYDSQLECCKGSYTGQTSGACIQDLPSPPTAAPIGSDAPFFPIWSGWDSSYCDNDPTLNTSGAQYFYATQAECCDAWFSQQSSGACMQHDPVYGSRAPTGAPVQ